MRLYCQLTLHHAAKKPGTVTNAIGLINNATQEMSKQIAATTELPTCANVVCCCHASMP
jgi:hypothetical protein